MSGEFEAAGALATAGLAAGAIEGRAPHSGIRVRYISLRARFLIVLGLAI